MSEQGGARRPIASRAPNRGERGRQGNQQVWYIQLRNLVLTVLALAAGWWITEAVFSFTGHPPALAAYLISIAVTILLAGSTAFIGGRLTGRQNDDPSRVWTDLGDALDRIARGDFSVRVQQPRSGMLTELVESVNNMAAGLGSVEQQRQEFISNVSHEIQSPLTSIAGFADLLRDGDLDDATRAHYLDVIRAETSRLSKLSDNLLRLSSLDSSDDVSRSAVRVDEQVRRVVLMLEPQWSAKDQQIEVATVPVEVQADADMLQQVWINLLSNAIKYTPEAGSVRVRVELVGDACRVEVADTGIGIAAGDLPRVFERFFRADKARSGEGNGLGLSLVKRVVELHGGSVTATSRPESGSTFSVSLRWIEGRAPRFPGRRAEPGLPPVVRGLKGR
jgi:two-component system, OmpR family, phosphate regulon sensor histidine kinase PhoR